MADLKMSTDESLESGFLYLKIILRNQGMNKTRKSKTFSLYVKKNLVLLESSRIPEMGNYIPIFQCSLFSQTDNHNDWHV